MTAEYADWLARTTAAADCLFHDLAEVEVRTTGDRLRRFLDALEAPPDALHAAALTSLLAGVSVRLVHALHDQEPEGGCRCSETGWSLVGALTTRRARDPRRVFRDWLDAFSAHLEQEHPPCAATRAAALIRHDPAGAWMLGDLARAVGTRPARLRQDFEKRFGMRPSAYVHLARTVRALALFRTSAKVASVAEEVGYRSKKDLYAALARWVGTTPTGLRALADDERRWLERQLRIQCLRGRRDVISR